MDERLPINSLVELQDQFADLYPQSPAGARGWVRARQMDEFEYPHVFIEWDKEHWRYRGESDGWAMETHFRPVTRVQLDKLYETPNIPAEATEFADKMSQLISQAQDEVDANKCPHCGENHDLDERSHYLDILSLAEEHALQGEGFFVITVKGKEDPHHPGMQMFEPDIFSAALTDEAKLMLEAQISHMAALLYRNSTQQQIKKLQGDK